MNFCKPFILKNLNIATCMNIKRMITVLITRSHIPESIFKVFYYTYASSINISYYVILPHIISLTHKNQQSDWSRIALYWPYYTLGLNIALFDKKQQLSISLAGENRKLLIRSRLIIVYKQFMNNL